MNVPIIEVHDMYPSFTHDTIIFGEGVEPHHAVKIGPGLLIDSSALRVTINFAFPPSMQQDGFDSPLDTEHLIWEKKLISDVDFLIRSSNIDWAGSDPSSVHLAMLGSRIIHDGKLTIRKADPDDMTGDQINLASDGDQLGLMIEFNIFEREADAYIPYQDAIKFFDFVPYVLDYEGMDIS